MNDFRFEYPWALALLLLPVAVGWWSLRRQRRVATVYSSSQLVESLPVTARLSLKPLLPWLRIAGLALLVVALARPQLGLRQFRVRTEGIAIAVCVDRSGSMQALDFSEREETINRLAAVKRVLSDFVRGSGGLPGRPDDPICLIAFGGFAETLSPLTLDHDSLLEQLAAVEIPRPVYDAQGQMLNERMLEEELATAIGDAVTLAVDRLKDDPAKSKVILLLSDGENTAGAVTPEQAADAAKRYGIKIHTIGVGSTGLAPFPATDRFGREVITRQRVRLDETTLRMLADETGGRYFNAQDTLALQQVYAAIDQLEKTETQGHLYTQYNDLYLSWLVPGLLLIVCESLLQTTWLRSLP